MPRGQSLTTKVSQVIKGLTTEQMQQLAAAIAEESTKPQIDRKKYAGLKRKYTGSYAKMLDARSGIVSILTEAEKTNDEINMEIAELSKLAEELVPKPRAKRKGAISTPTEPEKTNDEIDTGTDTGTVMSDKPTEELTPKAKHKVSVTSETVDNSAHQ